MKRRNRGAALLLVLWILLLTAGLVAAFALTARTEALQGSALRLQLAGREAADAGVELAVVHLADPDPARAWVPDQRPYRVEFEGYSLEIRIQDEAGKLDINAVDASRLAALMQVLGVEAGRAGALAGAIQDWRDQDSLLAVLGGAEDRDYAAAGLPYGAKDEAFATVSELQQVLGMDLATYALLVPHVTIFSSRPEPEPAFASGPVLQAMGMAPGEVARVLELRESWLPGQPPPLLPDGSGLAGTGSGTYSVSSRATRPDGSLVEVTAVVRIGGSSRFGQLYAPLAWRVGEPD